MLAIVRPAKAFATRPRTNTICSSTREQCSKLLQAAVPRRSLTTQTVTDDVVAELAAKPLYPLTLVDLVRYGRHPIPASELYKSANFTLSILPSRLAHRIQSLRSLPFIVVSNPHMSKIHDNYLHSLSTLLPWSKKTIDNLEDEIKFTEVMADLVQTHANTISILSQGFAEARRYISQKKVTKFLDEHLRARIGTRLIAEQHIALHFSSKPHNELTEHDARDDEDQSDPHRYIGVIDTELCPAQIIRQCEHMVSEVCEFRYGVRPSVVLNGELDYKFAHIPVHLEYIITELLKNAFRATIERGAEGEPVEITIAPLPQGSDTNFGIKNKDQGNLDEAMNEDVRMSANASANIRPLKHSTPGVTIRIRDRGGGISQEDLEHIWDYSFTTFDEENLRAKQMKADASSHASLDALGTLSGDAAGSSIAGLGYGLPLGRAYAEYFGGSIAIQSMRGWGTDVYLNLRGVGKIEWSNVSNT